MAACCRAAEKPSGSRIPAPRPRAQAETRSHVELRREAASGDLAACDLDKKKSAGHTRLQIAGKMRQTAVIEYTWVRCRGRAPSVSKLHSSGE